MKALYIQPDTTYVAMRSMSVMTTISGGTDGSGPLGIAPDGYEDTTGPK